MVRGLKFRIKEVEELYTTCIYIVKTKALISCKVTGQLICAFVFSFAKSRISHDRAQITYCLTIKNKHVFNVVDFGTNLLFDFAIFYFRIIASS